MTAVKSLTSRRSFFSPSPPEVARDSTAERLALTTGARERQWLGREMEREEILAKGSEEEEEDGEGCGGEQRRREEELE